MSTPANALPPGTRLGEFELVSVIAVGGFGIVYRARDLSLGREVAIKEYMPSSLSERGDGTLFVSLRSGGSAEDFGTGLRSFINEARMLASFDHPSLLKVHRFWEANGTAYMAMPLLQGRSLKQVRREMTAPPDEAWLRALLRPLLEALQVLHAEHVYHRDISPDNIAIEPSGRPVLMDFGAARSVLADLTDRLTVILKPNYAPIEQYSNAGSGAMRQGPWTDLYALGATLHFLLTGQPPLAATARVLDDKSVPLSSQRLPGCSTGFLACVDWMLAPRPVDRPQSVAELQLRLSGGPALVPGDAPGPFADLLKPQPSSAGVPAPASQIPADWDPFGAPPKAVAGGSLFGAVMRWIGGVSSPARKAPPPDAGDGSADRTQLFAASQSPLLAAPPQTSEAAPDATVLLRAAGPPEGASPRALALTVLRCDVAACLGQVLPLARGETLIGRDSLQLHIVDPMLSARHARLDFAGEAVVLTDLGSTNGTWVNGVRAATGKAVRLQLGATIQVGSTLLSLTRAGSVAMPNLTGRVVEGRYHLKACLHHSPKGVLYSARKEPAGMEVVVKILSPDYAADTAYRDRFAAEARIAAQLQHPHICRLDDFGEVEIEHAGSAHRVPFAAYPVLGGGSLAQRVGEFGTLPVETIERWMLHAAEALGHAHAAGVVHGNLKPSALCFDLQSNLYVTDFAGPGPGAGGTSLFGTPGFTAPEQWSGEPLAPTSDQYGLAAIAYYVLTGSKAAEALADPAMREQALGALPPAAHIEAHKRFRRTLSPAVTQVLNRALAPAPADRYQDIAEFARDLAGALRRGRAQASRHVFISYRREDSAILATYIAERLEQRHEISAFVDVQGLDGAARFPARIERAIADCEVFVCILGAGTLQSSHVRREITIAADLGKPMIPVFQESYVPPDEAALDPVIADLLLFDGIPLLDRRNIYVHAAVDELARQVRTTIERSASR